MAEAAHVYQREFQQEATREERIKVRAESGLAYRLRNLTPEEVQQALNSLQNENDLKVLAELFSSDDFLAAGRMIHVCMREHIYSQEYDSAADYVDHALRAEGEL